MDINAIIKEFSLDITYDPMKAMNYRFEYHIFHAGKLHRIGRVTCDDIYPLIGEWIGEQIDASNTDVIDYPIFVFMDHRLWAELTYKSSEKGRALFDEISILFGVVEDAIVGDEPRVFEWVEAAV